MRAPARERALLAAILFAAAALRVGVYVQTRSTLPIDYTRFTELDNHTWHQFGARIAGGDILYRDAFLPCHSWAWTIATPQEWVEWYGGPSAFYQAPLYGYLIGAVYAVSGVEPGHVYVLQLALGVLRVLLVYWVARRFFSGWVPLIAALLTAVYGPYIFFETMMLRESLLTVLDLSVLLLALVAASRGRALHWGGVGLAAGLGFLAKPSLVPLAPLILLFLDRRPWRARLRHLAAYALLAAVPLGALAWRNVAVGQPPLQIDTRGPVTFISGNAPDTIVDGPGGFHIPPSTRGIVRSTGNRFPATVAAVLRAHAADPLGLLRLEARKAWAFWRDYEVPNNVNFYHGRNLIAGLRLPFTSYAFLLPPAVLGLIVTWRRRRELASLHLFMALIFVNTIAFIVLARFRLLIVPYLTLFAAAGWVWLVGAVRARQVGRVMAAVAVMGLALALTTRDPSWAPSVMHSRSFIRDLEAYRRLAEQRDPSVDRPVSFDDASRLLHQVKEDYDAGRYEDCIEPLREVLEGYPDLHFTRYVLARCYFETCLSNPRSDVRLALAERELGRVLAEVPDAPYAQGLKRALEGLRTRSQESTVEVKAP